MRELDDSVAFETITLERVRVAVRTRLPGIHGMRFYSEDLMADYTGDLVRRLEAFVLAEKLDPVVKSEQVEWPSTWWQALKLAHFPAWALRRWPVRYSRAKLTVRFDPRAIYPQGHVKVPGLGLPTVQVAVQSETFAAPGWPARKETP